MQKKIETFLNKSKNIKKLCRNCRKREIMLQTSSKNKPALLGKIGLYQYFQLVFQSWLGLSQRLDGKKPIGSLERLR